ncbi:hypothetical protein AKAW_11167 [Aspergillus luchuensis IFO 4308]|nr:hypothetical protein AKAW_11167 [Aspergillus luchuensis IFO 4308]
MLTERDARIDAEDVSGQHTVWRDVYKKMRCPGPPCRHDGQYCWQDPLGKKHYKLKTHHLRSLVKFVENGGELETHEDVPDDIRQQLYGEEEQRLEKQKKGGQNAQGGTMWPPININVLPSQSSHPSQMYSNASPSVTCGPIDIPGPLDTAIDEYTAWQKSRVSRDSFKEQMDIARNVALENCLDLRQIHKDQDSGFFVSQGVKVGAARRFVSEIRSWLEERGNRRDSEDSLD